MKQAVVAVFSVFFLLLASQVRAQDTVWLQVEAQPNLRDAQDRARAYAAAFPDVSGYQLASGWYAIVLGPLPATEAAARLDELRGADRVPGDSFVALGNNFRQQFWPVGQTAALNDPQILPDSAPGGADPVILESVLAPGAAEALAAAAGAPEQPATEVPATEIPVVAVPEETPPEARRSEADLTRADRELLQTAMQWKGFYTSAIDGAFGPGTRNAMASYQAAMGYEPTGVLTTRQRDELVAAYRADLAALGLEVVRDEAAGIEMQLPTALVEFDHYDPPFVHFRPKGNSGVRVLLISQAGDQNTLYGLYDIMQTLEIVPPEGERSRNANSFVLTGQSADLKSHSFAELKGGLVKGYTLVWRPQDDARMARVLAAMQASFAPFGDRAMDDTTTAPTPDQRRDLLAGLEVRRPAFSRSGFYIDAGGTVLTTAEAVAGCSRITLDDTHSASVALTDASLGIAVLKPQETLAPQAFATFQTGTPRLQAEVALAGYSYEDALPLPSVTFGTLADLQGLEGQANLRRLALGALPGDAGGPVLDTSGAVLGLLQPRAADAARVLPAEVSFAASAPAIAAALTQAGIPFSPSTRQGGMPPEDLTALAASMTVLVSCWQE